MLLETFCWCDKNGQLHKYHFVSTGPDEGKLKNLKCIASESGLKDSVHFIGHISGNEKSDAYHVANLFVISSWQEAMSIAILEAGICQTPVLITDQRGFNDVDSIWRWYGC